MADDTDTQNGATPEQIKRAQEYAYALLQPNAGHQQYLSWSQPIADAVRAVLGRQQVNETNKAQQQFMQQSAEANAQTAPVPTQEDKTNQENNPQTKIEGYSGPEPPPLPRLPSKEDVKKAMRFMTPEQQAAYVQRLQQVNEPVHHEVANGTLIGLPSTGKWTFQPKIREQAYGQGTQYGNQPLTTAVPNANITPQQGQSSTQRELLPPIGQTGRFANPQLVPGGVARPPIKIEPNMTEKQFEDMIKQYPPTQEFILPNGMKWSKGK